MDFLKAYDAVSAAERATPMELRDQTTGEVIAGTDGKPAIVLVKTLQCAAVIEMQRAESAASMAEALANDEVEPRFDLNRIEAISQRTAEALIAGFENIVTDDGSGGLRPLTVADAPAFVRLNRLSEAHMWREVAPPKRIEDETDDSFYWRLSEATRYMRKRKGETDEDFAARKSAAASAIVRVKAESEEEFAARKAKIEAAWLEPSFAQQVIDHARRLPRFLAGSATA